jgi:AcrR family transcriptional regulator
MSESRERLLDKAEELFMRKGLAATTLRDISSALGVSHASLYYHFPGGKEELFVTVTERNAARHRAGLAAAIAAGGESLRGGLLGAASWLLSHEPMDLLRLAHSDMPLLPEETARRLMEMIHASILRPLRALFAAALEGASIERTSDADLLAGAFLAVVEGLHAVPSAFVSRSKTDMARELIGILLKGIGYREGESG